MKKLAEILQIFFNDIKQKERDSKVIVFTQFRESAKEIKTFWDRKIEPKELVRSDVFLGQQGEIT